MIVDASLRIAKSELPPVDIADMVPIPSLLSTVNEAYCVGRQSHPPAVTILVPVTNHIGFAPRFCIVTNEDHPPSVIVELVVVTVFTAFAIIGCYWLFVLYGKNPIFQIK